jgi:hypothetical protein
MQQWQCTAKCRRHPYALRHTVLLRQIHVTSGCVENGARFICAVFLPNHDLKSCLAYGCIRRAVLSIRYRKWCPRCLVIYRNATSRKHCWPQPRAASVNNVSSGHHFLNDLWTATFDILCHRIYEAGVMCHLVVVTRSEIFQCKNWINQHKKIKKDISSNNISHLFL